MNIKQAISKLLYDMNIDPAEYRVIFKHQQGECWDVPFNYLSFNGNYFSYGESSTQYPLHRIVAIYNKKGEFLIKRKYSPNQVEILPKKIELIPGVYIGKIYDEFTIARYAWLIIQHTEELLPIDREEALKILGDYTQKEEFIVIKKGYFKGTIITENKILRGNTPIEFDKIKNRLWHQRIYAFDHGKTKIQHKLKDKTITIENGEIHITNSTTKVPPAYTSIILNTKHLTLIDNKTKIMLSPKQAQKIYKKHNIPHHKTKNITTKNWTWHKKSTLLITDHDTIISTQK